MKNNSEIIQFIEKTLARVAKEEKTIAPMSVHWVLALVVENLKTIKTALEQSKQS
tara:strand:- start:342 stop:506 length:165 start_codon:yes stop_codon:yes gene_type:complete